MAPYGPLGKSLDGMGFMSFGFARNADSALSDILWKDAELGIGAPQCGPNLSKLWTRVLKLIV